MSVMLKKGYVEPDDTRYQTWIDEHAPEEAKQACVGTAKAMAAAFPELRVVGVECFEYGHAWCVNEADEVVDPTAHQFLNNGFDYTGRRLELTDFPRGKCHWCGELIWPDTEGARKYNVNWDMVGPHVECDKAFMKDMQNERQE